MRQIKPLVMRSRAHFGRRFWGSSPRNHTPTVFIPFVERPATESPTAVFLQAPAEVFCLPAGMPPEPHSTNLFQNPCAAPHTTAAALHTLTIPTSTHTQQPQQPNRRPPGGPHPHGVRTICGSNNKIMEAASTPAPGPSLPPAAGPPLDSNSRVGSSTFAFPR